MADHAARLERLMEDEKYYRDTIIKCALICSMHNAEDVGWDEAYDRLWESVEELKKITKRCLGINNQLRQCTRTATNGRYCLTHFRRPVPHGDPSRILSRGKEGDNAVLAFMRLRLGSVTPTDVADGMKVSYASAAGHLATMARGDSIRRVAKGRYEVVHRFAKKPIQRKQYAPTEDRWCAAFVGPEKNRRCTQPASKNGYCHQRRHQRLADLNGTPPSDVETVLLSFIKNTVQSSKASP